MYGHMLVNFLNVDVDTENRYWQKRYPFICPVCKNKHEAAVSIFMQMGFNQGGGSCPKCKTYLRLSIIDFPYGLKMKAESYDEYVKKMKEEQDAEQK